MNKVQKLFEKIADSVVPFTDAMWNRLDAIKTKNRGVTFVPRKDGSQKIRYEGRGLVRYSGLPEAPIPAGKDNMKLEDNKGE